MQEIVMEQRMVWVLVESLDEGRTFKGGKVYVDRQTAYEEMDSEDPCLTGQVWSLMRVHADGIIARLRTKECVRGLPERSDHPLIAELSGREVCGVSAMMAAAADRVTKWRREKQ